MNPTHESQSVVGLKLTGQVLRVLAGVALLTASAKIQVPFWPVPMTLQVAAIMLLAASYGLRMGTLTMLTYLAVGAAGLPVFAGTPEKGIGLVYMLGGTGGYLAGFLAMTIIVGFAADRLPKLAILPAMGLGLVALYALGLGWLAQLVPGDKLLAYGFTPFIAGDLVKTILAAILFLGAPKALMAKLRGTDLNV
ncbi:Biotin ECF transporter S component BioY [Thalassovita gelatinovora]|uniref:Biotin transporter n=1 Tax=Thalassovita gelatinovora TaxID=53501 RepID=A0A0P1F9B8_THAGE|nr:biotin transporter BioY [Thalassovita gelatinovora]QIZ81216.1 biotin transporter BioY [Thalassovita gelatinovora]CUH64691.1 Biotin ECF transporter S component BioY [Thalassovita gelatinovora]SEP93602.1 biotin transport system substrate-specific component [Thalassovita gelatinovora]